MICLQAELHIRQGYMQTMAQRSENLSLKCKLLKKKLSWGKRCGREGAIWTKNLSIQVNKGLTPALSNFLKEILQTVLA